jgi:hypothetical protein
VTPTPAVPAAAPLETNPRIATADAGAADAGSVEAPIGVGAATDDAPRPDASSACGPPERASEAADADAFSGASPTRPAVNGCVTGAELSPSPRPRPSLDAGVVPKPSPRPTPPERPRLSTDTGVRMSRCSDRFSDVDSDADSEGAPSGVAADTSPRQPPTPPRPPSSVAPPGRPRPPTGMWNAELGTRAGVREENRPPTPAPTAAWRFATGRTMPPSPTPPAPSPRPPRRDREWCANSRTISTGVTRKCVVVGRNTPPGCACE